jgi:hypothetical protein
MQKILDIMKILVIMVTWCSGFVQAVTQALIWIKMLHLVLM